MITSQGLLRSPRVLLSILGLLCVASCGAGAAGAPGVSAASAPPPIAWQSWSAEAFARARRQHKLVLVDVGIEGCTACRWMEEATYADPRVRVRLAAHFVTIQVDADVRPDLGERFSRWGWPATVFFSPEGEQVLAVRGNKRPPTFLPILDDLISRAERGRLSPMKERAVAQAAPEESELGQLCLAASHMSDSFARARHGGYDARVQHVRDAPLRLDFLRGQIRGDEPRLNHALRTAEGYTQLLDPVWGGVFVASTAPDWSSPIPEKRTRHQAAALEAFGAAYVTTHDDTWLERARDVDRYVAAQMESPEGLFYATQEDAAPGLPAGMDAAAYYRLGDAERRRYGVPPVDHALYAELNGLMMEAYADLARQSGDASFLAKARRAADAWLGGQLLPAGAARQAARSDALEADRRMRRFEDSDRVFLISQARFGLGLVALYRASLEPRYLEAARRLVAATRASLEAPHGAFYASEDDGLDGVVERRMPLGANAAMARLMTWLGFIDHDDDMLEAAERTLRAVASPAALRGRGPEPVAEAAFAWETLTVGPVEISFVGEAGDPALARLLDAARQVRAPLRVIHPHGDDRYPVQERAAVFVCSRVACSSPLFSADAMRAQVAELSRLPADAPCGD